MVVKVKDSGNDLCCNEPILQHDYEEEVIDGPGNLIDRDFFPKQLYEPQHQQPLLRISALLGVWTSRSLAALVSSFLLTRWAGDGNQTPRYRRSGF